MERKIKVITINWTGKDGSIVSLIRDIEEKTKDSCEYYHCYQVGEKSFANNYLVASWNVTRVYYLLARVFGVKYGMGTLPTLKLLKHIDNIGPDVIHVHCPNFYSINLYMLFRHLKKKKYPVVITNHAEFFYTGNCAHAFECEGYLAGCKKCKMVFDSKHKYWINRTHYEWKKMKRALCDAEYFEMTVVSPWQYKRICTSPLTENIKVKIIENAVNTSIFKKEVVDRKQICEGEKFQYRKIILNVTSNFSNDKSDAKGGYYFIQLAKAMPEHVFLVAGNTNLSEPYDMSDNLILLGNISEQQKLVDYYNIADLTVLTSRRETYGMACAESLVCGTPVVGFEAGGTESIAIDRYSEFAKFGDIDGLILLINKWIDKKDTLSDEIAIEAEKRYSTDRMAREFLELYQECAYKNVK